MELVLIAIALAMDSVAVSIAVGVKYKNIDIKRVLKIAFLFGLFQALMPLIGYLISLSFPSFTDTIEHYIAFGILLFLGLKMIKEARQNDFESEIKSIDTKTLVLLAIATSIDALAVGMTFSFSNIDIFYAIFLIGSITFIMCIVAVFIGVRAGGYLEDKAEYLGGIILIFLGIKILLEGLI